MRTNFRLCFPPNHCCLLSHLETPSRSQQLPPIRPFPLQSTLYFSIIKNLAVSFMSLAKTMATTNSGSSIISRAVPRRPPNRGPFAASEPMQATVLRHKAWDHHEAAVDNSDDPQMGQLYHLTVALWTHANNIVHHFGLPTLDYPLPNPLWNVVSEGKTYLQISHGSNHNARRREC